MAMKLNDDELDALEGLPWIARLVYVFSLRRHMDYVTGTVGMTRQISWQSVSEDLYVEPHQGIKASGSPTAKQLRHSVEWLERAGLVTRSRRSNRSKKQLVFFCPLAGTDKSARNKVGSKWAVQQGRDISQKNMNGNKAHSGECQPASGQFENNKVGIHPVSGKDVDEIPPCIPPFDDDFVELKQVLNTAGWPVHKIQTAPVIAMTRSWQKQGVTAEMVHDAIEIARNACAALPGTPAYLKPIMERLIEAGKPEKPEEESSREANRQLSGRRQREHEHRKSLSDQMGDQFLAEFGLTRGPGDFG